MRVISLLAAELLRSGIRREFHDAVTRRRHNSLVVSTHEPRSTTAISRHHAARASYAAVGTEASLYVRSDWRALAYRRETR